MMCTLAKTHQNYVFSALFYCGVSNVIETARMQDDWMNHVGAGAGAGLLFKSTGAIGLGFGVFYYFHHLVVTLVVSQRTIVYIQGGSMNIENRSPMMRCMHT